MIFVHRLITCFLFLFFLSCSEKPSPNGYSDHSSSLKYKLISIGNSSKKARIGDHVLLKAICKINHDSVFWNSDFDAASRYLLLINNELLDNQIWDFVFSNYSEGDSLHLQVESEEFFRSVFNGEVPYFAKRDSFVTVELSIRKIMDSVSFNDFQEGESLRREAAAWNQKSQIEDYIRRNMKRAVRIDSLLYFEKANFSNDRSVENGKTVLLSYTGRLISGKIIDQVSELQPLAINFGAEQQVIRGLELALIGMKKGESAKIIIPSHLGFGNEGTGQIPPFTPLVYEIKIIDIK